MHALSDAEIEVLREAQLKEAGYFMEDFDAVAFARAVEAAVLKKTSDRCGIELGAKCPLMGE